MTAGFGIEDAIELFEKASAVDELARDTHIKMLWHEIKLAIRSKLPHLDYKVPNSLPGPIPVYNRVEIAIYLVEYCREHGFTVEVMDSNRCILRISGWLERYKERKQEAEYVRVVSDKRRKKHSAISEQLEKISVNYRK
jgi:hypothetical protein